MRLLSHDSISSPQGFTKQAYVRIDRMIYWLQVVSLSRRSNFICTADCCNSLSRGVWCGEHSAHCMKNNSVLYDTLPLYLETVRKSWESSAAFVDIYVCVRSPPNRHKLSLKSHKANLGLRLSALVVLGTRIFPRHTYFELEFRHISRYVGYVAFHIDRINGVYLSPKYCPICRFP